MHHEHLVYQCNHHFFFWHFQVDCDCHQSRILSQMPTHLNVEEQTAHTQIRPVPICKCVRRLRTVKPWDDPSWIMESDMTGTGGLPSSGTQSFYLCFTLKGFWGQKFTCCSLSEKDEWKKKPKCWQKRFVYWCEIHPVSEKSPASVCLCWCGFAKAWDRIPCPSLCMLLLWFRYFWGNVLYVRSGEIFIFSCHINFKERVREFRESMKNQENKCSVVPNCMRKTCVWWRASLLEPHQTDTSVTG